jgi:Putative transposase, YhgA-like
MRNITMARVRLDLPRDFPDRAVRDALLQPDNLRALVARVAPQLVGRLDFSHPDEQPRTYLLDDWREREADVLVRLPYREAAESPAVLLCILVEHWSAPDPLTPLRMLVYAVLFWEREWADWQRRRDGTSLRLTPVLPVVFHTGDRPWNSNRTLAELMNAPEAVRPFVPQWQTLWCDLAETTPDELLRAGEAWWQALAVVRAQRADRQDFLEVLHQALAGMEPLGLQAHDRWHQLLRLVLFWGLVRRPESEHAQVVQTVRSSHQQVFLREEAQSMTEQVLRTWEEELLARGEARGRAEGEARGHTAGRHEGELEAHRALLRAQVQQRFPNAPPELLQRIAQADLPWLQAAALRILSVNSPEELLP